MSKLYLKAESFNGKTVITETFFTAPLKTAVPFYRKDCTEVMMMCASAGMLDGDCYDIEIKICSGAVLKFTGQSYTKIFRSTSGKGVRQRVKLSVESGGKLIYQPTPVIPFKESIFNGETEAELCEGSVLVMQDVFSCGRTAMDERFQFTEYCSRVSVRKSGKLIFLDNIRLVPSEADLGGVGFFEGHTHIGTMYCYGLPKSDISCENEAAVTDTAEGWCVRMIADSSQYITDYFSKMI